MLRPDAADPEAGRRNLAIVIAGFGAMLNLYAPQAILPLISAELEVTPTRAALLLTVTALAVGMAGPFAGAVSDRFGRRSAILASMLGIALPTLACAFARSLDLLLALRFIQGLFMPAVFAATLAYIAEETAPAQRGRITALYVTANVTAGFCGRMIGSLAAQWGDWHSAFLVLGLVNLLAAAGVFALMPASRHFVASVRLSQSVRSMAGHLRNPRLLSCFAIGFGILFSQVAIFTYLPFRLAAPPYDLTPAALGGLFVSYIIGAAATPFSGRAIDRFGQRRTLAGATGVAVIAIALTVLPQIPAIMAGLTLLCLAMFLCQSTSTSYVGLKAGSNRSTAAGLYLAFYYAGGGAGAFLTGYAYAAGGWLACAVLAIAVQIAVGVAAIVFWR